MRGSFWTTVSAVIVVAVLILMMIAHQVRFTETAVVTRFDKVVRVIEPSQAGLLITLPWPIDRVRTFDARLRNFETEFTQLSTSDQKTITLAAYATWRIADANLFLRAIGREEAAADKIGDLLKNQVSNVLRRHPLHDLVNIDAKQMKFDEIEREIHDGIAAEAKSVYGVAIASVGIARLGLPESNTREVFERMKADRKKQIDARTAEGDAAASQIRSDAEAMAEKILDRADAYAKKLRSEGDARAAQYYEEFNKSPELSRFLQEQDALRRMLRSGNTTMIIDPTTFPPLRGLQESAEQPLSKPAGTN